MLNGIRDRIERLFVTGTLRLGSGATLVVEPSPGTERVITPRELAQAIDPPARAEILTAAKTLTSLDDGKTLYLSLAGGFTVTLPAPYLGGRLQFKVRTAPTTAYILAASGGSNIMRGGINELEVDTTEDGPYHATADTLNFVANVAVVGDWVDLESDGTYWYVRGQTNADGGVTFAST